MFPLPGQLPIPLPTLLESLAIQWLICLSQQTLDELQQPDQQTLLLLAKLANTLVKLGLVLEQPRQGLVNTPLQQGLGWQGLQASREKACLWSIGLTLELTPGQTPGQSLLSDRLGDMQVPALFLAFALHAGIASCILASLNQTIFATNHDIMRACTSKQHHPNLEQQELQHHHTRCMQYASSISLPNMCSSFSIPVCPILVVMSPPTRSCGMHCR
jgi:hypothetical protein